MLNDAIEYLKSYDWPGNIRQLANLAEYLSYIVEEGQPIQQSELPIIVREDLNESESDLLSSILEEEMKWLLVTLFELGAMGRRTLEQKAGDVDLDLSESQIRSLLLDAGDKGLVQIGKGGRTGSKLTPRGNRVASKLV